MYTKKFMPNILEDEIKNNLETKKQVFKSMCNLVYIMS